MPALPAVLAVLLLACASGAPASPDPVPSPDLAPEAVVKIVVGALQQNDEPADDAGLATAFRFASPGNQAATGPLARFTAMIRGGYSDMLDFERATYGRMVFQGDEAAQRVTLVQANGRRSTYVFALSKQVGGECDGCWMTDAVVPVAPQDDGLIRT